MEDREVYKPLKCGFALQYYLPSQKQYKSAPIGYSNIRHFESSSNF
jgi:hypothetical protein